MHGTCVHSSDCCTCMQAFVHGCVRYVGRMSLTARTCMRLIVDRLEGSGPVYVKRFRPFSGQNVFRLMRLRLSFTLKHRKRVCKRPKTKTASKVFSQAFSAITFLCKRQKRRKRLLCMKNMKNTLCPKPGNRKILQLIGPNHGSSSTENGDAVLM